MKTMTFKKYSGPNTKEHKKEQNEEGVLDSLQPFVQSGSMRMLHDNDNNLGEQAVLVELKQGSGRRLEEGFAD